MLVAVVGEGLGSGKTCLLTFIAKQKFSEGYNLYTNYGLKIPHKQIYTYDELKSVRNGVFLGDDFWVWVYSRFSGSLRNKLVNKIMLKSRKRGFDVYYSTQHEMLMDWTVEAITDLYMICNYVNPDLEIVSTLDRSGNVLQRFWFKPKSVFDLFETSEEASELESDGYEVKVMDLLNDEFFINGCSTKESKKAYLMQRFDGLNRENASLLIDMVAYARRKKHFVEKVKGID